MIQIHIFFLAKPNAPSHMSALILYVSGDAEALAKRLETCLRAALPDNDSDVRAEFDVELRGTSICVHIICVGRAMTITNTHTHDCTAGGFEEILRGVSAWLAPLFAAWHLEPIELYESIVLK